ncbi:MAG: SpoVA/SpoVAEb family sporulation membrane protein [Clostridia bacterium]|nr:SpoVA/SpoVAEb family sporulation membrane protein [Clostridia bacterium]
MIKEILIAFVIGGLFCLPAQILIDKTALTPARILVLYVCAGVLLTALGVYGPLVDFAGRGATTPLTGFGYSLAEGVKKAVTEKGLVGALTGGITGAAGGITAAILFGWLSALFFKSRPKK